MNKRLFIRLTILIILCCAFASQTFANSVTVSLQVHEIKVLTNSYGSYWLNGQKYTESKSFFFKTGDSIEIIAEASSKKAYLKNITCMTDDIVLIGKNAVSIGQITSNSEIELDFARISSSNKNDEYKCDGGKNCVLNHFIDVDTKAWYHHDVDYVVKEGLMKGTGPNTFEPHSSTTRAMIVTMLHRLEKEPITSKPNIFVDVEENLWYSEAVNWATSNEIVFGYGDGKFGPNDPITREQMVAILYRYTKYKNGVISVNDSSKFYDFEDIEEVSTYARAPMKWACSKGIILGDNNQILPQSISERCQIAAILHRFCTNILK